MHLNKSMLWLMTISCGLTVGANFFSQPIIHSIQHHFQITTAQTQLTVTFAQISYACGLLFLVPLGDTVNKTKFIPLLMSLAGIGLLISACSINIYMLWIGTLITGTFSVAAQVLIPFAASLTKSEKMGETVGFLMSGLLIGIQLSTTLSGILSNLFHWKIIYILSAILIFFCAFKLKKSLPTTTVIKMHYFVILKSMAKLLIEEKRLLLRGLIGACSFASMSILYSTISTYLSGNPFYLQDAWIGIVSLVGIFGALSSKFVGQLADKGFAFFLSFLGCACLLIAWGFLYFSSIHLIFYLLGFGVLTFGLALHHSTNLSIIYRLRPEAKSRINSIYMTLYFGGAASGSALGIYAWNHGGWMLACITGLCLVGCTFIIVCFDYLKYR